MYFEANKRHREKEEYSAEVVTAQYLILPNNDLWPICFHVESTRRMWQIHGRAGLKEA